MGKRKAATDLNDTDVSTSVKVTCDIYARYQATRCRAPADMSRKRGTYEMTRLIIPNILTDASGGDTRNRTD